MASLDAACEPAITVAPLQPVKPCTGTGRAGQRERKRMKARLRQQKYRAKKAAEKAAVAAAAASAPRDSQDQEQQAPEPAAVEPAARPASRRKAGIAPSAATAPGKHAKAVQLPTPAASLLAAPAVQRLVRPVAAAMEHALTVHRACGGLRAGQKRPLQERAQLFRNLLRRFPEEAAAAGITLLDAAAAPCSEAPPLGTAVNVPKTE